MSIILRISILPITTEPMGIGGMRANNCRITKKQKRAESPLIALQPASDHRRVLN